MSGPALRELIAQQMRIHDWRLVRSAPDLMVFEKALDQSLATLWDVDHSPQNVLRAHISLAESNEGIALRAIGQRVDLRSDSSQGKTSSARELRGILEEVRRVAVSQADTSH